MTPKTASEFIEEYSSLYRRLVAPEERTARMLEDYVKLCNGESVMIGAVQVSFPEQVQETQERDIMTFLRKYHSITPLEAQRHFGCMRLAARIFNLRRCLTEAESIRTEIVMTNSGKKFARYHYEVKTV